MIENFQLRNYERKSNIKKDVANLFTSEYTTNDLYKFNNLNMFLQTFKWKDGNYKYHNYTSITDTFTSSSYYLYDCEIYQITLKYTENTTTKTLYVYDSKINFIVENHNKLNLYLFQSIIGQCDLYNLNLFNPCENLRDLRISHYKRDDNSFHLIDLSKTMLENIKIINSEAGINVEVSIILPNTTTKIEIDMLTYHLTLIQNGTNLRYKGNGYEKLLIKCYDLYGLTLPLYLNPNNWNDSNFEIYINSSVTAINNLKIYPSVFVALKSLYLNPVNHIIYNLHLIDSISAPNDTYGSYKADTSNTNTASKTINIMNFICECSIYTSSDFTNVIHNLMGNYISVNIVNTPF